MSNESGNDSTQQNQSSEDSKPDTSKIFSKGYNEGVETEQKRVLKKFSDILGQDFSDLDDVYGWGKQSSQKLAESVSDPTQTDEYKQLQKQASDYKQAVAEAQKQAESIKNQYKIDSTFTQASNTLKESSKFKIPESDVKDLFMAKHNVEFKDGKEVVRQGDTLLMDESGNHKSLEKAFIDFSKSYLEPATDGAGGGSGDGGGAKPKFAEYKALMKANRQEEAHKKFQQAKSAGGWAEADAPQV